MEKIKMTALLTLISAGVFAQLQDSSLIKKTRPAKPHEIGISVLTPIIMMSGATENNDRFTNLTYRYRATENHAFKAFAGTSAGSSFYGDPFHNGQIVPTSFPAVYLTSNKTRPSNFQVGVGYEYLRGRKFKQLMGVDLFYNNKFEKQQFFYVTGSEVTNPGGNKFVEYNTLDTGSYVVATNYNSVGINLSYGLRYEISPKWAFTATTIASFKFSQARRDNQDFSNLDFNFWPLGDISVFYRF